ncbi:unnamed protein product [Parajaminaea phylloscopi]
MPSRKKKGGKGSRPDPPAHTDSLRADIAAAADPFGDAGDNDGDVDIAAELLASLDARDEAESRVQEAGPSSLDAPPASVPAASSRKSAALDIPSQDEGGNGRRRGSSGGSGFIEGLKEAGGRILHHVSPSSSSSALLSPPKGDAPALAPEGSLHSVKSSGSSGSNTGAAGGSGDDHQHRGHGLRGIFGHKSEDSGTGERKVGRQKARKQRKEAEAAADKARFEEELKANGGNVDEAEQERKGILLACDSLGVDMHEINPDGHCLYSAIADQLALQGMSASSGVTNYQSARQLTARFMRQHKDDFAPFISDSDERMAGIKNEEAGGKQTPDSQAKLEEHYLEYCDAIETTGVWGGQPEILAMSRALQTPIWVIQAGQPIVKVGQEEVSPQDASTKPLLISYHRRMYGLGEHYNSLHPRKK